ncbi:vitamin K epoxide reductase family protein [Mycobacterium sp. BMJ-28]
MTAAAATEPDETSGTEPDETSGPVGPAGAWWILIAGIVGLAAALTLTIEKIEILINPAYVPSCSINPVLSCGSVMITPQASVFGFPNPLIGIAAFSVVVVTGVLAVAKVRLPRWYWVGLAIGTALGAVFIHWLIFQSLYRIGALCPYCMAVWAVTIPLFVVVASIALRGRSATSGAGRVLYQWRWSLVALWFTSLLLMILVRFWNYWSTLL